MSKRTDVLDALKAVEVIGTRQAEGLQVFDLRWPAGEPLDYATMDEALEQHLVEIAERDEGGHVPAARIVNKSNRMVFMMAGELLVGCKQDRVLNTSVMVAANSEAQIPVVCVEAGRWAYRSRKFRSSDSSSHGHLRMMVARQTSAHYQAHGAPGSDQGAVWKEVARKMGRMGSRSPSGALYSVYESWSQKLDVAMHKLSAPEAGNGVAFAIDGKIVGADFFDKPTTLAKLWKKLVKGYAVDALEEPKEGAPQVPPESVVEWLRTAAAAKQESFNSPGVGEDVRLEGKHLVGAALVVQQHAVHVELFREEA